MGYFIYHHLGCSSIYRPLSYPLRSLRIKISLAEKLISNVISWCVTRVIQKDSEIGKWKIKIFSTIIFAIKISLSSYSLEFIIISHIFPSFFISSHFYSIYLSLNLLNHGIYCKNINRLNQKKSLSIKLITSQRPFKAIFFTGETVFFYLQRINENIV